MLKWGTRSWLQGPRNIFGRAFTRHSSGAIDTAKRKPPTYNKLVLLLSMQLAIAAVFKRDNFTRYEKPKDGLPTAKVGQKEQACDLD